MLKRTAVLFTALILLPVITVSGQPQLLTSHIATGTGTRMTYTRLAFSTSDNFTDYRITFTQVPEHFALYDGTTGDSLASQSEMLITRSIYHSYVYMVLYCTPLPGYAVGETLTFSIFGIDDSLTGPAADYTCNVTTVPNTPPEALLKTCETVVAAGIDFNLDAAVSDANRSRYSFHIESQPEHGTLYYFPRIGVGYDSIPAAVTGGQIIDSDRFHYLPDPGFAGQDHFLWHAHEADTSSGQAALVFRVVPNAYPVADSDSLSLSSSAVRYTAGITYGDANEFQRLQFTVTRLPHHGILESRIDYLNEYVPMQQGIPYSGASLNRYSNGRLGSALYFTPAPGYTGQDTVHWLVSDGLLSSDTAALIIDVYPNTPPSAQNGHSDMWGSYRTISLRTTDATPGFYRYGLITAPVHGTLTSSLTGKPVTTFEPVESASWLYEPDSLFWGGDTFTWCVYEAGTVSNTAMHTISVPLFEYRPIYAVPAVTKSVLMAPRTEGRLRFSNGYSDKPPVYRILSPVRSGLLEWNISGNLQPVETGTDIIEHWDVYMYYTPSPEFNGSDTLTWQVTDGRTCDTAKYIFEETADTPPLASDLYQTVKAGERTVPLNLYASDIDVNRQWGDSLAKDTVSGPAHGILKYDGIWCYTPDTGYAGPDTFVWFVRDICGAADTARGRLTVLENSPLEPEHPVQPVRTWQNTMCTVELQASDSDCSQPVSFTVSSLPRSGSLKAYRNNTYGPVTTNIQYLETTANAVNAPQATFSVNYYPDPSFTGLDTFVWTASDGFPSTDTVTVVLDIMPDYAAAAPRRDVIIPAGVPVDIRLPGPATYGRYTVAVQPDRTALTVYREVCTVTADSGTAGVDGFVCLDNAVFPSDTVTIGLLSHTRTDRGGQTVLIIADSVLYHNVEPEVARLRSDMRTEGYTAEIVLWSRSRRNSLLWTLLSERYHTPGTFLAGAVLIGQVPWGWDPGTGYVSDFPYWDMSDFDYSDSPDIWVSRISATDYAGTPYAYGTEAELIRRALDANHTYRTGTSRLPHTAFTAVYDSTADQVIWDETTYNYAQNAASIWPRVVPMLEGRTSPDLFFSAGGEFLQSRGHGGTDGYWGIPLQITAERVFGSYSPVRSCMIEACDAGTPGGVVNAHLFAKNGGTVIAIGAAAQSTLNSFILLGDTPEQETCRARLAAGDSWGNALAGSFPFQLRDEVRPMYYGDLSLPVMPHLPNAMPRITAFNADRTTGTAPFTVHFNVTAVDPDSGTITYAWYPEGYQSGMAAPAGSGTAPVYSFTYTEPDTYLVRVEAVDGYMARTCRELEVIVLPVGGTVTAPPVAGMHIPGTVTRLYRLDGTAVLHGNSLAPGVYLYRDPVTGVMTKRVVLP